MRELEESTKTYSKEGRVRQATTSIEIHVRPQVMLKLLAQSDS